MPAVARAPPKPSAVQAFGAEDMWALRSGGELAFALRDARTAIPEAVRYLFFTGDPARRNVRIRDSYAAVDYWDGKRWWMMGVHEALEAVTSAAVRELEHCVDWSDAVPERERAGFEEFLAHYGRSAASRECVRAQVLEVMIRPFPRDRG